MHSHDACAAVTHLRDELLGFNDHQVGVEWLVAQALNVLDDGEAKGDIGDEDTVHNVEMEQVGAATVDHVDVALQVAEVG
jgi:hypothetical protein